MHGVSGTVTFVHCALALTVGQDQQISQAVRPEDKKRDCGHLPCPSLAPASAQTPAQPPLRSIFASQGRGTVTNRPVWASRWYSAPSAINAKMSVSRQRARSGVAGAQPDPQCITIIGSPTSMHWNMHRGWGYNMYGMGCKLQGISTRWACTRGAASACVRRNQAWTHLGAFHVRCFQAVFFRHRRALAERRCQASAARTYTP